MSIPGRSRRNDIDLPVTTCAGAGIATCAFAIWLMTVQPVLPAQSPAPQSLSANGKLGPVQVDVQLTPAKPLIGDPLTLTITVAAEKGVELLMPEFGEALDRFQILDFVPRERVDAQGRTVATQQYRLQAYASGKQAIPPILVEFVDRRPNQRPAPEGSDAYEILTNRLEFEVQSVLPKNAQSDLRPPLGQLKPLAPPAAARWPWLVAAAAVLAVALIWGTRAYRSWRARARRRSAYDVARARLDRLLARRRGSEPIDCFYVELSAVVRRYLEDRFEMRAPELTTEEFLDSVRDSADLTSDHQVLLREFLREADLVKFAGMSPTEEDIQRSTSAAVRFLEETRENAPWIESPAEPTGTEANAMTTGA